VGASSATLASSSAATLADVLDAYTFSTLFTKRTQDSCRAHGADTLYTYANFLEAARKFPDFATTGTQTQRKLEVASFLAHTAHETSGGWGATLPLGTAARYFWGYCFSEELLYFQDPTKVGYRAEGHTTYPPVPGQSYHGRGPMQITWNYNYGQLSELLFGTKDVLLADPDRVLHDGVAAFESGLWFWMTRQYPKPSPHEVITGIWVPTDIDTLLNRLPGFGMTTVIINGGVECGQGGTTEHPNGVDRQGYLTRIATALMVDPGPRLDCRDISTY
jgi:hypothetical protein